MKNLILIIVVLVFAGCNLLKHGKSSATVVKEAAVYNAKYSFTDSSGFACFISEAFVSDALNHYTIASITKEHLNLLKCSRESMVNRHDHSVIDTVYTFYNTANKIQIYRAKQNDFIFTFDVTDPVFKLTGNIKPGITKEAFSKNFNITQPLNKKVQIVNSEGTMRFMFYFENDILKRINSFLYLD